MAIVVGVAALVAISTNRYASASSGVLLTETFDTTTDIDLGATTANVDTVSGTSRLAWRAPRRWTFESAVGTNITADAQATTELVVGDIDGDGELDVVAANNGSSNRLYLGDGAGGFSAGVDVTADAHGTWGGALGDVDRDGDLDFVAGNSGATNRLYLNNGSGSFSAGTDVSADANPTWSVALADVDGDDDLDLIAGNLGGRNRLYRNDGTGSFDAGADITVDAHQTWDGRARRRRRRR